jgi:hypothetical protein
MIYTDVLMSWQSDALFVCLASLVSQAFLALIRWIVFVASSFDSKMSIRWLIELIWFAVLMRHCFAWSRWFSVSLRNQRNSNISQWWALISIHWDQHTFKSYAARSAFEAFLITDDNSLRSTWSWRDWKFSRSWCDNMTLSFWDVLFVLHSEQSSILRDELLSEFSCLYKWLAVIVSHWSTNWCYC